MMWPSRKINEHRKAWIESGGKPLDKKTEKRILKALLFIINVFILKGQKEIVYIFFGFIKFVLKKNGLEDLAKEIFKDWEIEDDK